MKNFWLPLGKKHPNLKNAGGKKIRKRIRDFINRNDKKLGIKESK